MQQSELPLSPEDRAPRPGQIGPRHSNAVYRIQGTPTRYELPAGVRIPNVTRLAQQIAAGAVPVGKMRVATGPLMRRAAQRHLDDLVKPASTFPYRFDRRRGAAVAHWIETHCHLAKGKFEGLPFKLNWWQHFLIRVLFGWVYRRGEFKGERRFRKIYLEQAKGSGKSPIEAAIAFYMLCADGEVRGEGFVIGKNAEQAGVANG